ncbi:MAG TPA: PLP-dependent aminotransferase family protein [Candidatus Polarisedimenticolaceae bacterium]
MPPHLVASSAFPETAKETRWSDRLAQRAVASQASVIRELLKLTQKPDIISFAGGLPAPEIFPVAEVREACERVLRDHGAEALQYSPTEGYPPLRELLVRHMKRYGIDVDVPNVVVTTGSQQALDLIGRVLINPGDRVLCEEPTYLGALQAWNAYQAQYLAVPIDDDGLRVELLEQAMRAGPKFLYVLPNFQNPAGVTLSLDRRHALVAMASHYGVPIVEDDPYGQLRYEGEHLPSIVALDAEFHGCAHGERTFRGDVLYLGTLSKTLAPGLRIGWIVAPEEIVKRIVQMKQGADLHSSTFAQAVAYEVARGGFLDRHVQHIRSVYRERRDAMLAALDRWFPRTVRWTRPQGGLFLWLSLPEGVNTTELLHDALAEKVAFVPGGSFFPGRVDAPHCRLNFSHSSPDRIEEGIRRLSLVVARRLRA